MKNGLIAIFALLITLMALSFCFADGVINPVLNIRTIDGNTDTYPYQLKVSNGSLTDNGDGTATLSSGLNWDDPTVIQNVNDISGWTIATDSVYLTDTSKFVDVDSDVYAENINYNEGMLSDPTISDATGTAISITSADCLIRSDATWDNGRLIRKTVPENLELVVTDNSTNYIYVSYNSGSPIYAATTDRDVLNNSDALPVARVYISGGNIEYQLSYQYLGRSAAIRNFDRVMRIRGRFGIEPESGLGISESGTRVVNIGSGFAWFGLSRKTLDAVAQGGVGVTSHLWYHNSGIWTEADVTAYNNTQYDNGTNLATLTAGRHAVNWVFRNMVTDELDIVLGTGDYTLAQAEASTLPALPEQISNFYVLCGRIIVRKSENTAYAIENVSTSTFNQAAVTVHNDLSSLQGGTTGEYYHLTSAQSTALATPIASTSINWDNVNISNPILMGGINWQDATIAPAVDGVNVWNISDKDSNAILSVDSTNNRVGIGTTTPSTVFDVLGDSNATTTINAVPAGIGGIDANAIVVSHFDGTDTQTSYTAETGQSLTFVGSAQLDDGWKAFGTTSLLLNGSNSAVHIPDSTAIRFPSSNFTLEARIRIPALPAVGNNWHIFMKGDSGFNNGYLLRYSNVGGTLQFQFIMMNGGGGQTVTANSTLIINTEYHIAAIKNGANGTIYLNGVNIGSGSSSAVGNTTTALSVGSYYDGSGDYLFFNGWIDEARVSNTARWTANFTPPIEAYSSSLNSPQVKLQSAGTTKWTVGSDGTDSDKFKIGSTALGTGTALSIAGTTVTLTDVSLPGGSSGKATCWKTATAIGYCSSVVAADGTCTCN